MTSMMLSEDVALEPADYQLVYDCLRFALDHFVEEDGARLNSVDRNHLIGVIERLEEFLTLNATTA